MSIEGFSGTAPRSRSFVRLGGGTALKGGLVKFCRATKGDTPLETPAKKGMPYRMYGAYPQPMVRQQTCLAVCPYQRHCPCRFAPGPPELLWCLRSAYRRKRKPPQSRPHRRNYILA